MTAPRRHYVRTGGPREALGRAASPAHKFKVGQHVRFIRSAPQKISKEVEQSLFTASFAVERLLPAAGSVFQYRVRNLVTGQERVAEEAEIVSVSQDG